MRLILLILFFCISASGFAQSPKGKTEIIADEKIQFLLREHISLNERQSGIQGFRIQIYFDSGNQSKNRASRVRAEFASRYPSVNSYLNYDEPYYKVRVGDFRTRLDATRFLKTIQNEFPSAFIVIDRIGFPAID